MKQIEVDQAAGRMPKRPLVKNDFIKRRALMLPESARYDVLLKRRKDNKLSAALVAAMYAIEEEFEPLRGQLPKDYDKFESDLLEDLLRAFDREALRNASGDVFGRIYEYFLMKFAMQVLRTMASSSPRLRWCKPSSTSSNPITVRCSILLVARRHVRAIQSLYRAPGRDKSSGHLLRTGKTATTIRLAKDESGGAWAGGWSRKPTPSIRTSIICSTAAIS